MKDELAWGTQKNYHTTQRYVYEFLQKKWKTSDIYLDELNYKFIKDFEKYIKQRTPDGHQKPCAQNGAMKHVERLRKMVNLAIKEEWLMKDPFIKFKLKFEKKERDFLTQDELERIEEKDFHIDRLDQTRDIFAFSCYTGLSYAEVYDLTANHIITGLDGKCWIQGRRRKSKEWFKVPLRVSIWPRTLPKWWICLAERKPRSLLLTCLISFMANCNPVNLWDRR